MTRRGECDAVPRLHHGEQAAQHALPWHHEQPGKTYRRASRRARLSVRLALQGVRPRLRRTFDDPLEAIAAEKRIKRWRRQWKIELIEKSNPEWQDLTPFIH